MASVRFTYVEPTLNADETPLADLAATRVYRRPAGGGAATLVQEVPASQPTGGGPVDVTVPDLPPGTWEFYAVAVDAVGNESALSTLDTLTIPAPLLPNLRRSVGLRLSRGL